MIRITDDLFDIAWRLRAVDGDYELYYNTKARRYEVWALGKRQAVIPYKTLDARAVEYVRRTRIERAERLLAEMEAENIKLQVSAEAAASDCAKYKAKHLVNYLARGGKSLPKYEEI